jgi:hypothetical protein
MPTGMEKEEEAEKHLQDILVLQLCYIQTRLDAKPYLVIFQD